MLIYRFFELLVFIGQKGYFSFQNIAKKFFLAYIAFKKKQEKWPFLDQNHGLTPLKKCQFFNFLNFFFLQRRKAFLRSRISQKTFSWPTLPKKKVTKMANVGRKPWVNPFEKMSIFRVLKLLVFVAKKGVFSIQNIVKAIFLAYNG